MESKTHLEVPAGGFVLEKVLHSAAIVKIVTLARFGIDTQQGNDLVFYAHAAPYGPLHPVFLHLLTIGWACL